MKSIIVYYSYTGNTKKIAEEIQEKTHFDILEIKPVVPYSSNYQEVVDSEEHKIGEEEIIDIEEETINLDDYDRIILGTPVWWYTMAPAVRTFLYNHVLDHKVIVPFITNGGWIGHTVKDIQRYAENATFEKEIDIPFNQDRLVANKKDLEQWIENLKTEES